MKRGLVLLAMAVAFAFGVACVDPGPNGRVDESELVTPKGDAGCADVCIHSYPLDCNATCKICGATPGSRFGKCLTALPSTGPGEMVELTAASAFQLSPGPIRPAFCGFSCANDSQCAGQSGCEFCVDNTCSALRDPVVHPRARCQPGSQGCPGATPGITQAQALDATSNWVSTSTSYAITQRLGWGCDSVEIGGAVGYSCWITFPWFDGNHTAQCTAFDNTSAGGAVGVSGCSVI